MATIRPISIRIRGRVLRSYGAAGHALAKVLSAIRQKGKAFTGAETQGRAASGTAGEVVLARRTGTLLATRGGDCGEATVTSGRGAAFAGSTYCASTPLAIATAAATGTALESSKEVPGNSGLQAVLRRPAWQGQNCCEIGRKGRPTSGGPTAAGTKAASAGKGDCRPSRRQVRAATAGTVTATARKTANIVRAATSATCREKGRGRICLAPGRAVGTVACRGV